MGMMVDPRVVFKGAPHLCYLAVVVFPTHLVLLSYRCLYLYSDVFFVLGLFGAFPSFVSLDSTRPCLPVSRIIMIASRIRNYKLLRGG